MIRYRWLAAYAILAEILAGGVVIGGIALAIFVSRAADSDTEATVVAAAILIGTAIAVILIMVIKDVAQWMHDTANLLDESVELLDEIAESVSTQPRSRQARRPYPTTEER